MSLRDAFKRQGDMLFRYRGWTFLAALALFLLALRDSDWIEARFGDAADDVYDFACLGVSLAGLAVRVLVAGTVPGRTSGRNTRKGQVATALNSTGAYSVVRHPLYFANFVIALGLALVPGSPWFAVTLVLGFALVFERIMLAEEEFLRSRFGVEFEEWAERTPAFIPDFSLWRPPALPYSARTALKREYLTTLEVLCAFALVDYLEDGVAGGLAAVEFEPETTVPAIIDRLLTEGWPQDALINVYFPDLTGPAVEGWRVTFQGKRKLGDELVERIDPRGQPYVWIGGLRSDQDLQQGSDLEAVADGCISVTPIHMDMTHRAGMERLRLALA